MKLFSWINSMRNPHKLSFKDYLNVLKYVGEQERAFELEISVPEFLLMSYSTLSYEQIYKMSWGEIQGRIKIIAKKTSSQLSLLEKAGVFKQHSVLSNKYGSGLINVEDYK